MTEDAANSPHSSIDLAKIEQQVNRAVAEDIGAGDVTTAALVASEQDAVGRFIAKAHGIVAGLDVAGLVFERTASRLVDLGLLPRQRVTALQLRASAADGDEVEPGDVIADIQGPARVILSGERLALNFLQHLSGIATLTRQFVNEVGPNGPKIMDTRKTTPGWRRLEKYAVKVGGGTNHRMGLYDMVLIKDNHLRLRGASNNPEELKRAVEDARKSAPGLRVEVEAENLDQVRAAVEAKADVIMLDNMSPSDMARAAASVRNGADPRPLLEASGGVTLDNIRKIARTGVDMISIGALTHSATALDISLEITPKSEEIA